MSSTNDSTTTSLSVGPTLVALKPTDTVLVQVWGIRPCTKAKNYAGNHIAKSVSEVPLPALACTSVGLPQCAEDCGLYLLRAVISSAPLAEKWATGQPSLLNQHIRNMRGEGGNRSIFVQLHYATTAQFGIKQVPEAMHRVPEPRRGWDSIAGRCPGRTRGQGGQEDVCSSQWQWKWDALSLESA